MGTAMPSDPSQQCYIVAHNHHGKFVPKSLSSTVKAVTCLGCRCSIVWQRLGEQKRTMSVLGWTAVLSSAQEIKLFRESDGKICAYTWQMASRSWKLEGEFAALAKIALQKGCGLEGIEDILPGRPIL
eukprot:3387235-Amphidinium_carterae.4